MDFFLRDLRIHDQNRRIVVLTKLDKTIPYKTTRCKYLAPQDDGSGNEYNYYIFQLDPSLNISENSVAKTWEGFTEGQIQSATLHRMKSEEEEKGDARKMIKNGNTLILSIEERILRRK